MAFNSLRPPVETRCFTAPSIETAIREICAKISDPELAWLFENCFPNTLDTTVTFAADDGTGQPDAFVITGDIDAMWLRDSTNQVWPYVPFAAHDDKIRALVRGLVRRQAACVLLDPYANAFYRTAEKISEWKSDHTEMKPGVHERKYELDSLAAVLRLAVGYYEATKDASIFDAHFLASLRCVLQTIANEQRGSAEQPYPLPYSFQRTNRSATETLILEGLGHPWQRTGMSRCPFRPSDDATIFQFMVPANAMAAVNLERIAKILKQHQIAPELAGQAAALGEEIAAAIRSHGIVNHARYGPIFAYEVDGFGSCHLMDEANSPDLLSLPYHGFFPSTDPVYQNTRRFALSRGNPYYHEGPAAKGLGSPHIGCGWIWPLGLIVQAITSSDDEEILLCLRTLKSTHAGRGFMHEAFRMENAGKFTRHWFAWANTFFGELILRLADERPDLLKTMK